MNSYDGKIANFADGYTKKLSILFDAHEKYGKIANFADGYTKKLSILFDAHEKYGKNLKIEFREMKPVAHILFQEYCKYENEKNNSCEDDMNSNENSNN